MLDYQNPALSAEQRTADLLSRMTLEEKAAQTCMLWCSQYSRDYSDPVEAYTAADNNIDYEKLTREFGTDGVGCVTEAYSSPVPFNKLQRYFLETSRLGIPAIFTAEALHGLSGKCGTIFPVPAGFGATFDPELIHQVGCVIGTEARAIGRHEILAPNLDVSRDPRWGRCEETFGEDTYLSSRMAEAIISGEQKNGEISRPDAVAAEPKHFCFYGIPENGSNCAPAHIGPRQVESGYLPVFAAGIQKGGAYNVMVSYNSVDGEPMMCSEYYLQDVLKGRMGLRGFCRSDWGGVGRLKSAHHLVTEDKDAICLAVTHGLDVQGLDYPAPFWKKTIVELVQEGRLSMERLDDIVARVLRLKFELGLFEHPYTDEHAYQKVVRCREHRAVALQTARESVTLLKNNGILPLTGKETSIALIGPSSAEQQLGGYSSQPQFHVPSVYEELQNALGERVAIRQCNGCAITHGTGAARVVDGHPHLCAPGEKEIADTVEEAVSIASTCDVIIMVGGDNTETSSELHDRCELTLCGRQRELIQKLAKLGKPLILVLENGKALELSVETEICDAIMMTWYGGEAGAKAIVEALLGQLNPAGRLPFSLPRSSTRIPCYYSMLPGCDGKFMEGPSDALYPFGYGLSYTSFAYSNLQVEKTGEYDVTVTCQVENTGAAEGDEVVQVYVDDVESSVVTPPMLLKNFQRIHLKAGERKTLTFRLDYDSFKLMDVHYRWKVEPGSFRILVGAGSRDIRLEGSVTL